MAFEALTLPRHAVEAAGEGGLEPVGGIGRERCDAGAVSTTSACGTRLRAA